MLQQIYFFIQNLFTIIRYTVAQIFGISSSKYDSKSDLRDLQKLPIEELFDIVMSENELNLWNKMAAMIDYTFPNKNKLEHSRPNPDELKELKYCVKHAAYAYFMDIIGDPPHLTVKYKDLSLFGFRSLMTERPGYFLAVDDREDFKYILLCIRGTETVGDALTDLDAHPDLRQFGDDHKFAKSYDVHCGIYDSAKEIDDRITPEILKLAKEYKDHKILVTGHSLGAGVCSLLGLLWNTNKTFPVSKFSCYSFASPLIIGHNGMKLSQKYGNMTSVAVSTDIVTRLSVEGLLKMHCRVNEIKKDLDTNKVLIDNIIQRRCQCESHETFREELSKEEKDLIERIKSVELEHDIRDDLKLYPCGKILWFIPGFILNDEFGESEKYQKLRDMIQYQCDTNSLLNFFKMISKIVRDFFVLDNNEMLSSFIQSDDLKVIDRWEFTQMVSNGVESWQAHFPGRYTNGFGVDVIDVFEMSKLSQILAAIPCLPDIVRKFIIIMIVITICTAKVFVGLIKSMIPTSIRKKIGRLLNQKKETLKDD